ncbi:hypothetical protein BJX66DRAFT_288752 [Aspergillus keveii]|uniref:Uncharacterized protein n=1 Tax=Aspergillus keveii TaxID=714993 RepID=A0ABR4FVQ5_9EURO
MPEAKITCCGSEAHTLNPDRTKIPPQRKKTVGRQPHYRQSINSSSPSRQVNQDADTTPSGGTGARPVSVSKLVQSTESPTPCFPWDHFTVYL